VARAGWAWAAVEGDVELIGPDDDYAGIDAEGLRLLLRAIFTAAAVLTTTGRPTIGSWQGAARPPF